MGLGWMMPLTAIVLVGCGGSSVSSGSYGSGGAGGSSATDAAATGDGLDMRIDLAGSDGSVDHAIPEDTGGGGGGTGGTPVNGADAADTGGGDATVADSGGGTDLPQPPTCQAGENCTGTYSCTASRCIRNEEEVCHCVNSQLFCGPVACTRDAGVSDTTPASDAAPAVCAAQTSTGHTCNAAQDRACVFACVDGRRRECFCSQITDEWICTAAMRC